MDMNEKKVFYQQILDDLNGSEEFLKSVVSAENDVSMQKVLNEKGYNVSLDDVKEMFEDGQNEILKYNENVHEELTENDLENVAGGGLLRYLLRGTISCGVAFGFGCICAAFPAAAAATPYVVGGLATWTTIGGLRKGW